MAWACRSAAWTRSTAATSRGCAALLCAASGGAVLRAPGLVQPRRHPLSRPAAVALRRRHPGARLRACVAGAGHAGPADPAGEPSAPTSRSRAATTTSPASCTRWCAAPAAACCWTSTTPTSAAATTAATCRRTSPRCRCMRSAKSTWPGMRWWPMPMAASCWSTTTAPKSMPRGVGALPRRARGDRADPRPWSNGDTDVPDYPVLRAQAAIADACLRDLARADAA